MKNLKKRFQTEIVLTPEQQSKFFQTRGVCRFVYNFYLAHNQKLYKQGKQFMSARTFSVWLNNDYLSKNPDKRWIKDASSKAVKQSMENAHAAYLRFFNKQSAFPKFKKKGRNEPKVYFVKNNKTDCLCERHRIKIPTFGWCKLKEKGYIPTTKDGYIITSGTLDCVANRFYITVLVDVPDKGIIKNGGTGLGIDLGIKDFAICSNGVTFKNVNKSTKVKKLEKRLRREQRRLSRKHQHKKKGETTQNKNIQKQRERLQQIYRALTNIRNDYVKQTVSKIVKTKPSYVTIEDLNVKGMMKNKHLAKAVANQNFYEFRKMLTEQCHQNGIEIRVVDRWYPSSKTCNCCGKVKNNLKLSDRTFRCECGYVADRDFNASLNLRDAKTYKIA